jgi:adenylate kinase family enzyme
LLDHYDESGRLYKVDGSGAPEDVFGRLVKILGHSASKDAG